MKYLRVQIQNLEPQLLKFEKIAFVHPPENSNESSNPKLYNYFSSMDEAKKWFLELPSQA